MYFFKIISQLFITHFCPGFVDPEQLSLILHFIQSNSDEYWSQISVQSFSVDLEPLCQQTTADPLICCHSSPVPLLLSSIVYRQLAVDGDLFIVYNHCVFLQNNHPIISYTISQVTKPFNPFPSSFHVTIGVF